MCEKSVKSMISFSIPRLLVKPFVKPRKLYGIGYKQTLFGVHVPCKKYPETTETWLLAFGRKDDAANFADELLLDKEEKGCWPTRIIRQPAVRNSPFWTVRARNRYQRRQKREKNVLQIIVIEERSLLYLCAVTGMLLHIGRKVGSKGFQFERSFKNWFYKASQQEMILHLEDMFEQSD